jgi:uncharacterized protein (TIGR00725 family)
MPNPDIKHPHRQMKICVSGAAETSHCGPQVMEEAKALGRAIAQSGSVIVTGATTGFPLFAAMGAKEAGGFSVGMSPATSEREHVEVYHLPIDYIDLIVYTGFGYSGRNLLLTRSSDAVIIGCGRVGTINEFTIAFEDGKPIGVLEGEWTTDELLREIMERGHRQRERIIFEKDPATLVKKMVEIFESDKTKNERMPFYSNPGQIL